MNDSRRAGTGQLAPAPARRPALALLQSMSKDCRLTGVPAVTLPYTVGGDAQSKDLFGLFDSTLSKLLGAAK